MDWRRKCPGKERSPWPQPRSKALLAFPTGVSMVASWHPDLVREVGAALGEEARALGYDVLLGPCVNTVPSRDIRASATLQIEEQFA